MHMPVDPGERISEICKQMEIRFRAVYLLEHTRPIVGASLVVPTVATPVASLRKQVGTECSSKYQSHPAYRGNVPILLQIPYTRTERGDRLGGIAGNPHRCAIRMRCIGSKCGAMIVAGTEARAPHEMEEGS